MIIPIAYKLEDFTFPGIIPQIQHLRKPTNIAINFRKIRTPALVRVLRIKPTVRVVKQ